MQWNTVWKHLQLFFKVWLWELAKRSRWWIRVKVVNLCFCPLSCRVSLRTRMERNTSTRSRSSLRCLRSPRGSWSSTLTSLDRRTSRSSRTPARWDHVCVCFCSWNDKCLSLAVMQWRTCSGRFYCAEKKRARLTKTFIYSIKSIKSARWQRLYLGYFGLMFEGGYGDSSSIFIFTHRWTQRTWTPSTPTSRWPTSPPTWTTRSSRTGRRTSRRATTSGASCSRRRSPCRARSRAAWRSSVNVGRFSPVGHASVENFRFLINVEEGTKTSFSKQPHHCSSDRKHRTTSWFPPVD